MDTSVFTKPEVLGPGIWFGIHIGGVQATNDERKTAYVSHINALCDNFKCKKCQPHFRKFIDTHPFKDYWNIYDSHGRDIGFFKWGWEMHNQVNKFLKKFEPTLDEAYEFFSDKDAGACFTCGEAKPPGKTTDTPTIPTNEMVSRAIPPILTLHLKNQTVEAKPFRMITKLH